MGSKPGSNRKESSGTCPSGPQRKPCHLPSKVMSWNLAYFLCLLRETEELVPPFNSWEKGSEKSHSKCVCPSRMSSPLLGLSALQFALVNLWLSRRQNVISNRKGSRLDTKIFVVVDLWNGIWRTKTETRNIWFKKKNNPQNPKTKIKAYPKPPKQPIALLMVYTAYCLKGSLKS